MEAYESYWLDPIKGFESDGMLPERRKDSKRVPERSIINSGRRLLGDDVNAVDILFTRKTIDETAGEPFWIESSPRIRSESQRTNQQQVARERRSRTR